MKEERAAIWQRLIDLNYIVAGMETFPASSQDPFSYIKPIIEESDYFVLCIGCRYGSLDGDTGKSFTQLEFEYAVELKLPILVFVISEDAKKARIKSDIDKAADEKLKKFIQMASSGRTITRWSSESDLSSSVIQAVIFEERRNPRQGWVRAGDVDIQSLLVENAELKEKIQSHNLGDIDKETYSIEEMTRIVNQKFGISVHLDDADKSSKSIKFALRRLLNLEFIFNDPSYESIAQSIKVIARSDLKADVEDLTNSYQGKMSIEEVLLMLRRIRVIDFDSDATKDNLKRGKNWLLAHEASRSSSLKLETGPAI